MTPSVTYENVLIRLSTCRYDATLYLNQFRHVTRSKISKRINRINYISCSLRISYKDSSSCLRKSGIRFFDDLIVLVKKPYSLSFLTTTNNQRLTSLLKRPRIFFIPLPTGERIKIVMRAAIGSAHAQ